MSMKRNVKTKAGQRAAGTRRRLRLTKPVIVVLAVCLVAAGAATMRWEPLRRSVGLAPLVEPAVPQQGTGTPSKEYIYAGGRLIATEEPTAPNGPTPTGFTAEAVSAPSVSLTWSAPASGNVTGYVVERRHSPTAQPVEFQTGSSTPGFTDTTAAADAAYLYRVRALFAGGGTSGYSNSDLATTVVFTDAPLQGKQIKGDHLKQARRAVSAVRTLAGQTAATWTYPDPVSSPPSARRTIYLEDILELRTQLNPALTALGIAALGDDQTLARGLPVKGSHIEAVRDKLK